jgi:hypothetical protein
MNIKLLNEITRINGLLQMLNENVQTASAKFVKSIADDITKINFKRLFKSFATEEEDAYNILKRSTSTADEIELAAEKLLKNINFSDLAEHLLNNKKLGTTIEDYIKTKFDNVMSGKISKKEALNDIKLVLNTWAESKGIKQLGDELSKKVKLKLPKNVNSSGNIGNAGGKIANASKLAEEEAKKLILGLTDEAKNLFTDIIESINKLKSKGLGTNVFVDINKINQAATEIADGSIAKNGDFVAIGLELEKLGITMADEIKKVTNLKIAQKGALSANDQLVLDSLTSSTNWFNKICNTVFDFVKGNKILSYLWKYLIVRLIIIGNIIFYLFKMLGSYLTTRLCRGAASSIILKASGFCDDIQSPEPSTKSPEPEEEEEDDQL